MGRFVVGDRIIGCILDPLVMKDKKMTHFLELLDSSTMLDQKMYISCDFHVCV